eukprot:CAMPEP_0182928066 /NCGR_PEP_ID=MMETSP0105_2-20130417/15097_1 /TAXON_ID=81532 ORGANISM="Acanthoeca-like sp., Strain 10tr" /NCGR_SAMPLE_ID=MMETSP0105_2 /ASSEMBLY_ACC=CAM_ASM_000205 /LENGTH=82 /DNA_ID=CAMNT_0025066055 /DNA_START=20 /DNA_END=268 /DNA_ORIENTATION=-
MARYAMTCRCASQPFFFIIAFAFWFFGQAVTAWYSFDQQQRNDNGNTDLQAATFFSAFSYTMACVFCVASAFTSGDNGYAPV